MIHRSPNNFETEWINKLLTADITDENINSIVEKKIANYTNVKYCSLTCNGTAAIYLGMKSLNLKPGDEIIIPDFGYWAVKICAEQLGLVIKYADVKYDTLCLDPNKIEELITNKTKAVCFVNHLGYVGEDILLSKKIADKYGLIFFEDSAQGLSQFYNNISAGNNGLFGIYSFSGTKLIRTGEGGCLITNDRSIYDYVNKAKDMGVLNFTMSNLCASLLNSQLDNISDIIKNRRELYYRYSNYIDLPYFFNATNFTGFNSIVYLHKNASTLYSLLKRQNIGCRYKFYKSFTGKAISNKIVNEYIELPSDYKMSNIDIENIAKMIKTICR